MSQPRFLTECATEKDIVEALRTAVLEAIELRGKDIAAEAFGMGICGVERWEATSARYCKVDFALRTAEALDLPIGKILAPILADC